MNHIHLLAKPDAKGRRAAALVATIDAARHLGFATTVLTAATPAEVPEVVNRARGDIERLVVVGGDGLVHHALPAIAGTGIEIGLVPSGTGNDFARALGIGHDLTTARPTTRRKRRNAIERTALLAPVGPIDLLASTDGRFAASVMTAGFSGKVTARADPMRFPPGRSKYTVATLVELRRLRPTPLRLRTPDHHIDGECSFFAVANTRYFGGGMAICPDASPHDGLLDVVVVAAVSAAELLVVLPLVFAGLHVRHRAVTTLRAPWVEIDTDEPLYADGEEFGSAPIRVEVGHGLLRLATTEF